MATGINQRHRDHDSVHTSVKIEINLIRTINNTKSATVTGVAIGFNQRRIGLNFVHAFVYNNSINNAEITRNVNDTKSAAVSGAGDGFSHIVINKYIAVGTKEILVLQRIIDAKLSVRL